MKTIKFVAYLFYRYYSTGPRSDIRYFSTIGVLTFLFFIHLAQVLLLFDSTNIIPQGHKSQISSWIKMALFLLPIFLVFRGLIKESELKEMNYDTYIIKKEYVWLIVYIILSVALFILLAWTKQ